MGSGSIAFYVLTLLVYAGVDIIACLGLNQQFGVSGVTNFGFIIFQAGGAYTAAVLSLPPQGANGGFQEYIGGLQLPFPLPWIGAAIVGGLLALPFVFLVGSRLRGDFAAIGLLVAAVLANLLVTNYRPFLNGAAGLSLVPAPLQDHLDPQSLGYQIGYAAVGLILVAATFWFCHRITESPYGRSLRAMREDDKVAASLGKNLVLLRTQMLVVGGMIAGLSGGVLVGFINLWAPSAWGYAETIVLFSAVIIGGAGNHWGAVLGAILVPLGFEEATRFIPAIGAPGLIPDLQWVVIGLLIVLFLRLRPQGILPERRRVPRSAGPPAAASAVTSAPSSAATSSAATSVATSAVASVATSAVTSAATSAVTSVRPEPTRAPHTSTGAGDEAPMANAGDVLLEVRSLSCSFGGVQAVSDVTFQVMGGRLTGLIGPNGAGKSTTLSLLAGTQRATGGQILYQGRDVTQIPAYRRARLGLVRTFQLASEFKRLTVLENLLSAIPDQRGETFWGAVAGPHHWRGSERANIERAEELLRQFGLTQQRDAYAGELSGGQRRLVEIMRALMAQPQLLLLDEPMAGVHPELAERIGHDLLALCARGMTIVMVEHELGYIDQFCDPVIVMAEGRILAQGPMSTLRKQEEVVEAYLVG